jgi:hypothetical protein
VASEAEQAGVDRQVARRRENGERAAGTDPLTDEQGLVEFGCECARAECDRSVKVPLYVYQRMVEAGDQYLVQAGHHAVERYRTLVVHGSMRIEEERG